VGVEIHGGVGESGIETYQIPMKGVEYGWFGGDGHRGKV